MADGLFYVDSRAPFITADIGPVSPGITTKALIPPGNIPTLGANYFSFIGKAMRIRLYGRLTSPAGASNLTMQLMYGNGADGNGVILATSAAITLTTSQSNMSWQAEYIVRCRSMGATGTLFCTGIMQANPAIIASTAQPIMIPASAAAASPSCDLTAALLLSPQVVANISGSAITVHDVLYEALN